MYIDSHYKINIASPKGKSIGSITLHLGHEDLRNEEDQLQALVSLFQKNGLMAKIDEKGRLQTNAFDVPHTWERSFGKLRSMLQRFVEESGRYNSSCLFNFVSYEFADDQNRYHAEVLPYLEKEYAKPFLKLPTISQTFFLTGYGDPHPRYLEDLQELNKKFEWLPFARFNVSYFGMSRQWCPSMFHVLGEIPEYVTGLNLEGLGYLQEMRELAHSQYWTVDHTEILNPKFPPQLRNLTFKGGTEDLLHLFQGLPPTLETLSTGEEYKTLFKLWKTESLPSPKKLKTVDLDIILKNEEDLSIMPESIEELTLKAFVLPVSMLESYLPNLRKVTYKTKPTRFWNPRQEWLDTWNEDAMEASPIEFTHAKSGW